LFFVVFLYSCTYKLVCVSAEEGEVKRLRQVFCGMRVDQMGPVLLSPKITLLPFRCLATAVHRTLPG
jgi:hypothetical protein